MEGMRWLALLGLAGCNHVLGLEETIAIETDRDGDGLLDVIDNCVDVPNPLQENQDGDELGDACDPCVHGSNDNEDGDAHLDGCDNCPHVPNDDQADTDGDGVGDACDHDNTVAHTRVRFDGFSTLTLDWIFGYVDWQVTDGAAHPATTPPAADMGMWNRRIEVTGHSWSIEAGLTPDATVGAYGGLYLRERGGTTEYPCYVRRTTTGWTLHTVGTTRTFATLPTTLRVRLRRSPGTMTCELVDIAAVTFAENDSRTGAGFYASSTAVRFHYVEAVSGN
jgi:hypothetical protein